MAGLGRDYDKMCPIFNWNTRKGGVIFPYFPLQQGQQADQLDYINLDGSASAILARVRFPMPVTLLTCDAFAVSDDQGVKAGASSTEALIHMVKGTYELASIDAGTELVLLTCDLSGPVGKVWGGITTKTKLETTEEIIVALKTAAAGGTSGNEDGGAIVRMWFAMVNAP